MADKLLRQNLKAARLRWGSKLSPFMVQGLKTYSQQFQLSVLDGDLLLLEGGWYVTHAGLVRLANRNGCAGIHIRPALRFSDPDCSRWAFKATVYKSQDCKGFVGYGDADPSNVSPLV